MSKLIRSLVAVIMVISISACETVVLDTLERVGIPKRDVLVNRVEKARDSQTDAQEQFASALDEFASVVKLQQTDLKTAYETLNDEYEDSKDAADEVSDRIDKVESVSKALFKEWAAEIEEYQDAPALKRSSAEKKAATERRYEALMSTMRRAEASMDPVLKSFRNNVLYLKHNLNAQAIGALRSEFAGLESDIATLIADMNRSIADSDQFIRELDAGG